MAGILSADTDDLAGHDIASASMWADRYRDSDRHGSQQRCRATREWHFVNHACIVDKIDQFAAELADPATNAEERVIALKFLLHLGG